MLYRTRDTLTDYYAGRQTVYTIQPPSDIAMRVALSGLARPALRVGRLFGPDQVLKGWNPLGDGDRFPDARTMIGQGHIIQRLCRGNGLKPDRRPRGCIICVREPIKGRVAVGAKKDVLVAIKKHIDPALELVPVPEGLKEAIETLATAQYYIGQPGDSMHLAAAIGLRSIIMVPEPVYLPQLVAIGDGSEWLYPQNVHLTLNGKTPLTPELSATSLAAALAGDVYPFWHDAYLGMGD